MTELDWNCNVEYYSGGDGIGSPVTRKSNKIKANAIAIKCAQFLPRIFFDDREGERQTAAINRSIASVWVCFAWNEHKECVHTIYWLLVKSEEDALLLNQHSDWTFSHWKSFTLFHRACKIVPARNIDFISIRSRQLHLIVENLFLENELWLLILTNTASTTVAAQVLWNSDKKNFAKFERISFYTWPGKSWSTSKLIIIMKVVQYVTVCS